MKNIISVALFSGRHDIPEAKDGCIFEGDVPSETLTSPKRLEEIASSKLTELGISNSTHCNIYVTGLTVALIAVLNECRLNNVKVTLYHFNRENGEYFAQEVL